MWNEKMLKKKTQVVFILLKKWTGLDKKPFKNNITIFHFEL